MFYLLTNLDAALKISPLPVQSFSPLFFCHSYCSNVKLILFYDNKNPKCKDTRSSKSDAPHRCHDFADKYWKLDHLTSKRDSTFAGAAPFLNASGHINGAHTHAPHAARFAFKNILISLFHGELNAIDCRGPFKISASISISSPNTHAAFSPQVMIVLGLWGNSLSAFRRSVSFSIRSVSLLLVHQRSG